MSKTLGRIETLSDRALEQELHLGQTVGAARDVVGR